MGNGKVLVAMSGGVDSSAAAYLLKEAGYEVAGVTMTLSSADDGRAAALCEALGIRHHAPDFRELFRREVIEPFIADYRGGLTPNPCAVCNKAVKFGALFDYMNQNGFDCLATGHYARITEEPDGYALRKGTDAAKDQSYMLSGIPKERLGRILFPLGGMTKPQARDTLNAAGLPGADQSESQDICFIPDGDVKGFIEANSPEPPREWVFVDAAGRILGRRTAAGGFTVGQRKGLNIAAGAPAYVCKIDAAAGIVIMGGDDDLFTREFVAERFNWLAMPFTGPARVTAKVRYHHKEQQALAEPITPNRVRVTFDEPQRAITPGQTAVLYDGDRVLGGGVII
ncbi:MAG: tRNA 2-thiouridine(34) synthase MnmA [Clostridiales bacterium]|jgi:tRNA-specific 2-thiouridylase|nr:tRNA 2-thiouridine(34) synthase MnmA [Clostridiales bacterium]